MIDGCDARTQRALVAALRAAAMDALSIEPIIVGDPDAHGPYGARGIGEPGLVPAAPAIANAINDAVGIRLNKLPMTSEEILAALLEKEGREPA